MRKTIIVILVAVLAVVSTANAQFLRFGVKGGVSSSNVKFDDITNITTTNNLKEFAVEQGESKLGLHFGFFGRIQILGLFIQPELLFTHAQGEVILTDVTANQVYTEAQ
ncbi:MAG: hypothetical protein AB9846_12020 [Tenuifilaceae bacterium]